MSPEGAVTLDGCAADFPQLICIHKICSVDIRKSHPHAAESAWDPRGHCGADLKCAACQFMLWIHFGFVEAFPY